MFSPTNIKKYNFKMESLLIAIYVSQLRYLFVLKGLTLTTAS